MAQNSAAPEGCGQNRALLRCETRTGSSLRGVSRLAPRGFDSQRCDYLYVNTPWGH